MNIADIIKLKFPGVDLIGGQVIIQDDGNGPYIAKWDDSLGPKPDQAMLDRWAIELAPVKARVQAREKRRQEYPSIGDQLDALLKQFSQMEADGLVLNHEFKSVKDQWQVVKDKYPIAE